MILRRSGRALGPAGPDFIGVGAMRGGTTWTYHCLGHHPSISFPAGKQVHFWDQHSDRGIDWYRGLFPRLPAGHISGEITPAYAILDSSQVRRVSAALPDLRVFYVLRDPLDRAWSSVCLYLRRNEITPDAATDGLLRDRLAGSGIRRRNAYRQTVASWTEAFGDAFAVFDHRHAVADPAGFLAAIADHLGVSGTPFSAPDAAMGSAIESRRNAGVSLAFPDDLRRWAAEEFADEVEFYYSLFGSAAGSDSGG